MNHLKREPPIMLSTVVEQKKSKAGTVEETCKNSAASSLQIQSTSTSLADAQACSADDAPTHSQHEKEFRRERGEMLLKLFRQNPLLTIQLLKLSTSEARIEIGTPPLTEEGSTLFTLQDTATARTAEKNLERAQLWEKITEQINSEFGNKLEALSVEKTKKLLAYYKKKDDGSYYKIKASSQSSLDDCPTDGDFNPADSPSRSESDASEHGGFEGEDCFSSSAVENPGARRHFQGLTDLLSSSTSEPFIMKSESPPSPLLCDATYNLKKERHEFVVSTAEHYLERMCFDNSSRSAQVNAERHNMWLKITHLTNEKYRTVLSPLGVEQIKKLFSNCKRRRRMRSETDDWPNSLPPKSPDTGAVTDPNSTADMIPSLESTVTHEENNSQNLQNLIYGLDLSIEIRELKRQLAEREAEVVRLQRVVVEQANDYRNRISVVIDFLRASAEKKVAEDVRNYLKSV